LLHGGVTPYNIRIAAAGLPHNSRIIVYCSNGGLPHNSIGAEGSRVTPYNNSSIIV